LTGQVLRVDGNTVQRLQGWTTIGEYSSKKGGALQPEELVDGLAETYGTMPSGRVAVATQRG
jgi:hypothetical protein